jgi:hypothetical protein
MFKKSVIIIHHHHHKPSEFTENCLLSMNLMWAIREYLQMDILFYSQALLHYCMNALLMIGVKWHAAILIAKIYSEH